MLDGEVEPHIPGIRIAGQARSDSDEKDIRDDEFVWATMDPPRNGNGVRQRPGPERPRQSGRGPCPSIHKAGRRRRHHGSVGVTHLCVRLGIGRPSAGTRVIPGWPPPPSRRAGEGGGGRGRERLAEGSRREQVRVPFLVP